MLRKVNILDDKRVTLFVILLLLRCKSLCGGFLILIYRLGHLSTTNTQNVLLDDSVIEVWVGRSS